MVSHLSPEDFYEHLRKIKEAPLSPIIHDFMPDAERAHCERLLGLKPGSSFQACPYDENGVHHCVGLTGSP